MIADRLAPLIGGVVVVSMLLLLLAFRSVVIAVTGAVMTTLSVAAAYGVVAFFLEGGWAGKLIGIDTATPMAAFVPAGQHRTGNHRGRNWWLPRSLARHLPQMHIEGPPMTSARPLDDAELIPTR